MVLVSPSERSRPAGSAAHPLPKQPMDPQDPPLLALPACASSPCSRWCVHSRHLARRSGRVPSGRGFQLPTSCSVLVVSHHLDGFLRTRAVGLLHPTPGLEVHRVSAELLSTIAPDRDPRHRGREATSPRRGHPSKGSPHQQPHRITAIRCPPAVAFPRIPRGEGRLPASTGEGGWLQRHVVRRHEVIGATRSGRLQGVAPLASPWRRNAVSSARHSLLPWASVPSEVPRLPLQPGLRCPRPKAVRRAWETPGDGSRRHLAPRLASPGPRRLDQA
jgi:hypothetical protein